MKSAGTLLVCWLNFLNTVTILRVPYKLGISWPGEKVVHYKRERGFQVCECLMRQSALSDKSPRLQAIDVLLSFLKKKTFSRHVTNPRLECHRLSHCGSLKLQEPDCMIHDVIGWEAAMPRSAVSGIRRNCGSSFGILSWDPFLLRPREMFARRCEDNIEIDLNCGVRFGLWVPWN